MFVLTRYFIALLPFFLMAASTIGGCSTASTLSSESLMPTTAQLSRDQGEERRLVQVRQPNKPPSEPDSAFSTATTAPPQEAEYDVVTVFWGTNRKIASSSAELTEAAFGADNAKRLSTGMAHVTIPKIGRDPGTIQRPSSYAVLGVTVYAESEDPARHFTIGDLQVLDTVSLVAAAEGARERSRRFRHEAFVFVHGYNTDFEASLFRTAQLAYDMEFDGVPYVFSWPSKGDLASYLYDRDAADSSQRYLLEFLDLIARETRVSHVHLIAHSMGTRLLVETLKTVSAQRSPALHAKVRQIVLAAPDIDVQVFEEIARSIKGVGEGTTLYASSNDQALVTSRKAAMGRPRAGEITSLGPTIAPGIDSIDITDAGFTSLWSLNHTTFAERSHILKDLQLLIESGTRPPDQRFPVYKRREASNGSAYWQYVKN